MNRVENHIDLPMDLLAALDFLSSGFLQALHRLPPGWHSLLKCSRTLPKDLIDSYHDCVIVIGEPFDFPRRSLACPMTVLGVQKDAAKSIKSRKHIKPYSQNPMKYKTHIEVLEKQ